MNLIRNNNIRFCIGAFILSLTITLYACGSEDELSPSNADINLFTPNDNDNSPTAQLCRQFKEMTGCYLLFNDTLMLKQNGSDIYGNPIWDMELVDMSYSMIGTSNANGRYTYTYINDYTEQKKTVDLFMQKVTSRLGKMVPYSFLLVNSISTWSVSDGIPYISATPTYLIGNRCYAVSIDNGKAFTDANYFSTIFQGILQSKLSGLDEEIMEEFRAPVQPYYYKYKTDIGMERVINDELAMALGFMRDYNRNYFCISWNTDLGYFVEALCTKTKSELETEYANYPIIIQRLNILREIIDNLGVKL